MTKKKDPKDCLPSGRPNMYSPELAEKVCDIIATHPHGIKQLSKMYDFFPSYETIYTWCGKIPVFFDQYLNARKLQSYVLADSLLELPNEIPTYTDEKGVERIDAGMLGKAKFTFEARRWHASKFTPKVFGENYKHDDSKENNEEILKDALNRKNILDEKNKKPY